MEIPGIARALHVLAVVVWIGGVAMVTTVLLPAVRHSKDGGQVEFFERLEAYPTTARCIPCAQQYARTHAHEGTPTL